MWNCRNVQRTVNDLYLYAKENDTPLLTNFVSVVDPVNDFWDNYVDNYETYDWYFAKMFKNYRYFDQDVEGDNPVEDVFADFQMAVTNLLMLKDKAYTQLFKIESATIPSPTSDYDITEERGKTIETYGSYVSGQREDTSGETIGQRTNTDTSQIMAYNSTDFVDQSKDTMQYGSQTNSGSLTKGEQTNTESRAETTTVTNHISGTKNNPNEMLNSYVDTWNNYSFYKVVFMDICKELLLV